MGLAHSPSVVTDGLVLSLDAGNLKNYNVGVSTNWTNKFGGNNGTLYGGTHHTDGPFVGAGYVEFDGNTDKLSCTPSNLTGQFTIEGWWYATAFTSASVFFGKWGYECLLRKNGSNIEWYSAGNVSGVTATYTFNTGQWYHLAVSRDSSNVHRVFINGVQVLSTTDSDSITMTDFCIGAQSTGSTTDDIWTGYISNFRIVNGTALYTSNFTVPTKPLTAVPNTTLLTCQGNTIADASSSALSITTGGDAAARLGFPASAFEFDGSDDYVILNDLDKASYGTTNFSLSLWFNADSGSYKSLFQIATSLNSHNPWIALINYSSGLRVYVDHDYRMNVPYTQDAWNNFVLTFDSSGSGLWTAYLNGSSVSTYTGPIGTNGGSATYLGHAYNSSYFDGKISNFGVQQKTLTATEVEQNYNATKGRYA